MLDPCLSGKWIGEEVSVREVASRILHYYFVGARQPFVRNFGHKSKDFLTHVLCLPSEQNRFVLMVCPEI